MGAGATALRSITHRKEKDYKPGGSDDLYGADTSAGPSIENSQDGDSRSENLSDDPGPVPFGIADSGVANFDADRTTNRTQLRVDTTRKKPMINFLEESSPKSLTSGDASPYSTDQDFFGKRPWHMAHDTVDAYKELVQHQLYYRSTDPFAYLTNAWLEGSQDKAQYPFEDLLGQDEPEDEENEHPDDKAIREEKEEKHRKVAEFREAEALRMEELVNDSGDGWKLWLRGRDLRSEFKVQPQLSDVEVKLQEFEEAEKARPRPPRKVKGKFWMRAPADAREPKGTLVCWRTDFVKSALSDASLLNLERPTISAEKVREMARKDWDTIELFYWHVEAVDLDGNRELWSPSFVGYLWEYWQRAGLGEEVQMSEDRLRALANSEGLCGLAPDGLADGLFPRKPVKWAKPKWKPPKYSVPPQVFHRVGHPGLPALPRRFQHNLPYKDGPLEKRLARKFAGTEAWDALVGTSDRLQAAARSMLRAEKMGEAFAQAKAEAQAKKDKEEEERRLAEEEERLRLEEEEEDRRRAEAAEEEARRREELGLPPVEESSSESESEEEQVVEEAPKSKYRTKKLVDADELIKATAKSKGRASVKEPDAKAKAKPKAKKKKMKVPVRGGGGAGGGNNAAMMMMR